MPDIREILQSLDSHDKEMWQKVRTDMRRAYITAHNSVLGVNNWSIDDDAFVDLIDIKLALLFDKAGHMSTTKDIVSKADAQPIEESIHNAASNAVKLLELSKYNNLGNALAPNGEWGTKL
jgi:hypothetical protein